MTRRKKKKWGSWTLQMSKKADNLMKGHSLLSGMTKLGRASWFQIPQIMPVLRHPSLSILKFLRNASG
jgi:hypothetical protein